MEHSLAKVYLNNKQVVLHWGLTKASSIEVIVFLKIYYDKGENMLLESTSVAALYGHFSKCLDEQLDANLDKKILLIKNQEDLNILARDLFSGNANAMNRLRKIDLREKNIAIICKLCQESTEYYGIKNFAQKDNHLMVKLVNFSYGFGIDDARFEFFVVTLLKTQNIEEMEIIEERLDPESEPEFAMCSQTENSSEMPKLDIELMQAITNHAYKDIEEFKRLSLYLNLPENEKANAEIAFISIQEALNRDDQKQECFESLHRRLSGINLMDS